jgi:hypothetical protein
MLQRVAKPHPTAPNKHRLNDRYIGDLLPKEKPFLVWDTIQRGLVVQVQPSGNRSFKVIYNHFIPANYHLLVCLCRHVIESRRITALIKAYRQQKTFNYREYGELLRIQQSQSLIIARLSRSMRLSQQATKDKNMRLPGRIIDKPEEW